MTDHAKLSKQAMGMIVGLAIQFILGIAIIILVTFPESGGPQVMWEYAKTQPLVMGHILLGTLLFLGSIALAIRSYKARNRIWITSSLVGLIAILVAWLSGEEFVSNQNDAYSFSMAIFFILGILSYVWGIYRSSAE